MNRREALKTMGMTAAGIVLTSVGVGEVSAKPLSRKRIILYFTGTGNSLHVARSLADDTTELLSIPQLVKEQRFDIEADEIGLVYPVYGHMPPNMVRNFLLKSQLNAGYKFAILTYGNHRANSVELLDDVLKQAGMSFDYMATIIMVDNWLPHFDMNEQMRIDKHIPENIAKIRKEVDARLQWREPVSESDRQFHDNFMRWSQLNPETGFLQRSERHFDINADACISCGICKEVCPRGNYELGANGIQPSGDCDFCFACIHNCPQKAIGLKIVQEQPLLTRQEINPNARYRNENISLADIKRANRQ